MWYRLSPRTKTFGLSQRIMLLSTRQSQDLSLRVASPGILLNAVAFRYSSLPRILMEYVDNAFDDAEIRRRSRSSYEVTRVQILLDPHTKCVLVRDSGSGMPQEQLMKIVTHVGLSGKASVPWLNGRFGFGVHAFRAAAKRMIMASKPVDKKALVMVVDRDAVDGIPAPHSGGWDESYGSSGTTVFLRDIDDHWKSGFGIEIIAKEIEQHFERMLSRTNVVVEVGEANLKPWVEMDDSKDFTSLSQIELETRKIRRCTPFDYDAVKGTSFKKILNICGSSVGINLKIAQKEYVGHRARFFILERRINEVCNASSFMSRSKYGNLLWGHPQLLGYIDLGDAVEPVITRDELKPSSAREELYNHLIRIENPLKEALDEELERNRDLSFMGLEGTLASILDKIVRGELKEPKNIDFSDASDYESESEVFAIELERYKRLPASKQKDESQRPKSEKKPLVPIRFCEIAPNDFGEVKRAQLLNNVIEINTIHPDFQKRLKTKHGKVQFDERFAEYLAVILSAYSRDWQYSAKNEDPARQKVYDDLLGTYSDLENALRRRLKKINITKFE